ncbi:glycosyltransferase [Methylogaea oryzae]|uniref:glycosyltransferase n=1 Tax=Methylogaea oryzae TaxID=1295382 RepID=UPI0012E26BA2|nr:glycosyltransferase [Methylogaea oryzae]
MPGNDYILDTLGVTDKKRLDIWFANVDGIDPQPMPNNEKLSVFCGSRVSFRPDCHPKLSAQDFKGTDILLKGFGGYCRLGGQGKLSLIRKGQDVEAACQLIDELGIVDRVCWYDEMPTWQFYENMASADLICDQFSATLPGLVTSDAYALGRPVMANFRNESFSSRFPEVLPGFDVSTADEVADQLITLENNREVLTDMGLRSREYAEKYLSPKSMAASLLERLGQV